MIPEELYDEIKNKNCVIFAGAGISTEGGIYAGPTFYNQILSRCRGYVHDDISFPELMQIFCEKYDGGKKNLLIRKIIDRIEKFSVEGEVYHSTTLFHKYVAQIPFFRIIVTTNWDDFFERRLNVLVPMVEDRDIPFWDDTKRQVLKIHGCVTRPDTIIATKQDYETVIDIKEKEPIFTKLKDLLATKTFLFVGYSMRDEDIQLIFDKIFSKLHALSKLSYVLYPFDNPDTIQKWEDRNIQCIQINPINFLTELIRKLTEEEILPHPGIIKHYYDMLPKIVEIHLKNPQETENQGLSAMYQDGLIHQLKELEYTSKIGVTTEEIQKKKAEYIANLSACENNLIDYAYYSGRIEVLNRVLNRKIENIPYFFDKNSKQPTNTRFYEI